MRWNELAARSRQLGFAPRQSVRWLAPGELWRTAVKVAVSWSFIGFWDKRELQAGLEPLRLAVEPDEEGGCWLDFVADLGDGFDATYSVATLLAAPSLDVARAGSELPVRLPRGAALVMGGDEVYPTPSAEEYDDRLRGPYRAALPSADPSPLMLALPGNHDWYDGLTAFLRVFCQRRQIGGWHTAQARSYFVLQLPQRWWLVGLDTQLGTELDDPQRLFFRQHLTANLQPGDGVIVCAPAPTWVYSNEGNPDAFNTLHWFDRRIVRERQEAPGAPPVPTGASVRLWLTGDRHHYSRYVTDPEQGPTAGPAADQALGPATGRMAGQLVTCGLGGAYLAATHTLPHTLELPPAASRMVQRDPPNRYRLVARHPDAATSRQLVYGVLSPTPRGIPLRNPGFWQLAGVLQGTLFLLLAGVLGLFIGRTPGDAVRNATVSEVWRLAGQAGVWFIVVMAAWTLQPLVQHGKWPRVPLVVAVGTGSQLLLGFAGLSVAVAVPWPGGTPDWVLLGACLVGTAVVTGLLAAYLFAATILLSHHGPLAELQMSAQAIEDHKGFVRIRIDRDGTLTLYPVLLEQVCHDWDLIGEPLPAGQRPVPRGEQAAPRLIEPPVVIPRSPA